MQLWKICDQYQVEISAYTSGLVIKQYWIDGATKILEEILEEYRQARRKKRDQMWFLYIDLRKDFDEIERSPEDLDCENDIFHLGSPHGKMRSGK